MATFVIVHGGWGGGWEWTPVARKLRQRGHDVFTPTLTGLGERAHLGREVGLSDHIDDVEAVFTFEELSEVVLCGHSSGGMVVTGVADRLAGKVRLLVYLDGFVPEDGQALHDLIPAEFGQALVRSAEEREDHRVPMPPELLPPEGVIPVEVRTSYVRRTRPHPVATQTEPIRLTGAIDQVSRAYVRCTDVDAENDLLGPFAVRARAAGWLYRELPTAHDLQLLDPDGTAALLDELAGAAHST
jgi:pimeloyl-ACP methyl ester carboxylesterase